LVGPDSERSRREFGYPFVRDSACARTQDHLLERSQGRGVLERPLPVLTSISQVTF
jgi:hypothetical protein